MHLYEYKTKMRSNGMALDAHVLMVSVVPYWDITR